MSVALACLLAAVHWAQLTVNGVAGAMIYAPLTLRYEPWRVLTSGFLHNPDDPWHLVANLVALLGLGVCFEQALGRWKVLTVFLASIVGGLLVASLVTPPMTFILGASGGIFGLLGALLVAARRHLLMATAILLAVVVDVLIGVVTPGISWSGHLGGFLTGVLIFAVLQAMARPARVTYAAPR
jgi:membrane associated rhomboid family serine protease